MTTRYLPGSLDPGDQPLFTAPGDVMAWVRAVDWILYADRAVLLHVDHGGRLTCVATNRFRLQHLGPTAKGSLAGDALECQAAAVLVVDLRRQLSPKAPSTVDRRRHRQFHQDLAVHGIPLLDTVIVTPDVGVSVTGSVTYSVVAEPSWLRLHSPRPGPTSGTDWAHQAASSLPLASEPISDGRRRLWLVRNPDG